MKARQRGSETARQGTASPRVRTFRDLVAWQRGMDLAEAVYEESERLPAFEKYGLMSQMRRAAVSVPANIAEGHARESRPDYIRCLRIARGSLGELYTHYLLAVRVRVMPPTPELEDLIKEEARILQALIRSLERLRTQEGPAHE